MQTKQLTFYETLCRISVVLILALVVTFIVFPLVAIEATQGQMTGIAVIFTIIITARDYFIRRFFNDDHHVPTL